MDEVALIKKWMEEQVPGITKYLQVDNTSIYYVASEGLHFSLYGNEMVPVDWLNKHRKPR